MPTSTVYNVKDPMLVMPDANILPQLEITVIIDNRMRTIFVNYNVSNPYTVLLSDSMLL